MKAGDEKTVTKTYTEEDNVPGYAGKTITLRIKLDTIKSRELPEVDDDLAQDIKSTRLSQISELASKQISRRELMRSPSQRKRMQSSRRFSLPFPSLFLSPWSKQSLRTAGEAS